MVLKAASFLIALFKALPSIKSIWEAIIAEYTKRTIATWDKKIYEGIKVAVIERDQRELEKAINNPGAGLPSGNPGTVIKPPDWMP